MIDNDGATKLTRNPEFHARTKYIDIRHYFVREKVEQGEIDTLRVDSKENNADILTKTLEKGRFLYLRKKLGLTA